jgi:PAS domain S-box-containing protein
LTDKAHRERQLSKLKKAELIERLLDLESRGAHQSHDDPDLPLRRLIDASPSAALVTDGEKILTANEAACRLYGAGSINDFTNVLINDFIERQGHEISQDRRMRALESGETSPIAEFPSLKFDGTKIIVEASLAPIRWQGKPAILCFQNDITDRKNREVVDRRLATMFETSVDAIIGSTPDAIITDWNPAAEILYGYSAEEIIGKSIGVIVPPELWKEGKKFTLQRAYADNHEPIEVIRKRKDGALIDVSLSISPIKDANGNLIALSTINRDITDGKRTEAALQESEERYRNLVEINPVAVLVVCKGNIVYVNPAAIKFFGAQRADQIIGKTTMDFSDPDSLDSINSRREQISKGADALPFAEHRYVTLDGRNVIAETSATVLTWNGEPAHQIIARDITDARTAQEALNRSEELLRGITDNSPHVVYLKDKNLRFLKVNKAFEKLYGASEPEVIDQFFPEGFDQNIADELNRQEKIVLSSGEPYEYEFEFTGLDGETHHIHSIKFPVFDSNGEVFGCGGISTDRTEFKLAERALAQSEARLNAFFDHAPVGLAVFDKDFRYIKVNSALAETNDLSIDDHIGRRPGDVINWALPAEGQKNQDYELDAPQNFINMDVSGETRNMPGVQRHWIVSRFPIPGEGKPSGGYGSVVVEITDRKHTEEALRASEQRLRDIAETGTDWIWEMNADLEFTWISDSGRSALGQPDEFYAGKSIEEIGPTENGVMEWRQHLENLRAHQPFRDFPSRRVFPDGLQHHLLTSGNPVFSADGEFTGYRGTGRDITVEIEAKELSTRVQERFLKAMDLSEEGLVFFDSDERIVLINQTFLDGAVLDPKYWTPGASYEDLLRKMVEEGVFNDQHENRPEEWIENCLARFRANSGPFEFQLADGRWRRVHYERLQDGSTIARYLDITASRQREETLRQAQKMEAVG